jgi:hypothetical protein
MKKTAKDLEKLGEAATRWVKFGLYYMYIPLVLYLGYTTVKLDNFLGAAAPL